MMTNIAKSKTLKVPTIAPEGPGAAHALEVLVSLASLESLPVEEEEVATFRALLEADEEVSPVFKEVLLGLSTGELGRLLR